MRTQEPFYISASALGNYFTCPRKYKLSREWTPIKTTPDLKDGIDAHAMLAGGETKDSYTNRARYFYDQLRHLSRLYEILETEKMDEVNLSQALNLTGRPIVVRRIIDVKATQNSKPLILDYKTARWMWKVYPDNGGRTIIPKALTFQSVLYLIPPTDKKNVRPFKRWPTEMRYLVADEQGVTRTFTYDQEEQDWEGDVRNLIEAINAVRSAAAYPAVRGLSCDFCQFMSACYQTAGWEAEYEKRPATKVVEIE